MNIDKALELDEQYVEAKLNKAEALEGMKDYEGAFLIYEHIIKDMHDYSYYEEAHKMLKKMKKYEKNDLRCFSNFVHPIHFRGDARKNKPRNNEACRAVCQPHSGS